MKVYELMGYLKSMPAGKDVVFHTLLAKENAPEYMDDPNYFELDFKNIWLEELDDVIQISSED